MCNLARAPVVPQAARNESVYTFDAVAVPAAAQLTPHASFWQPLVRAASLLPDSAGRVVPGASPFGKRTDACGKVLSLRLVFVLTPLFWQLTLTITGWMHIKERNFS